MCFEKQNCLNFFLFQNLWKLFFFLNFFEMKNKGRMQIFENEKVVSGPRDYQENVRRSRKCRVDLITIELTVKNYKCQIHVF